jgi:peroxiredoxin
MQGRLFFAWYLAIWSCSRIAAAIDPYLGNDPYWVLLHEPAVVEELKLSRDQRTEYTRLLDELDLRFFPLRNKPGREAVAGMTEVLADVQKQLQTLLRAEQQARLNEILYQFLGSHAFVRDDVRARLRYTDSQWKRINEITDETQKSITRLLEDSADGTAKSAIDRKYQLLKTDEQKQLMSLLKPEQQAAAKSIFGKPFATSELRKPAFRAPQLIDTGEWINSSGLRPKQLKGKVVVVHFYACGCINCIHNYPSYRQWHDQFKNRDVVLIGIHTPETASERDSTTVRRKAADEKLSFPILIDGKSENWNAWGNSMWPSIYLIDRRGYLRDFWPGELNWQGAEGEKYMRDRIEKLLDEKLSE